MGASETFLRLGAMIAVGAGLSAVIALPDKAPQAAAGLAAIAPSPAPRAEAPCAPGRPALSGPFAPIEDVISVSPLGGVTAPGEVLPAPYLRVNMRKGETHFERRESTALAPARADIVAVERRVETLESGAQRPAWTVHFQLCETVSVYYDRLDHLEADILTRLGGLGAFSEVGGPEHLAIETRLRVDTGDVIGRADGFDVGLHDAAAPPATLARPERYRKNPYFRAAALGAAPSLLKVIETDQTQARCALDYMADDLKAQWADKLGDAFGMRRPKGEDDNACRTALIDLPGSAQGAWFTDSSHNAATTKVSAIALAPDTIDQSRQIFALHGRTKSLTPDLVALAPMMDEERAAAAKDFLTFSKGAGSKGAGRINQPFALVSPGKVYCYEDLRANFVGPKISGVILLETLKAENGADLLRLEARGDAWSCIDLAEPWGFTGAETTFYR